MPFETRCPECAAKLRLDDAPPAGTPIECSKCGTLFVPPRAAKAKAAAGAKPAKSGRPRDDDEEDDDAPRKPAPKPTKSGLKKPKSITVDKTANPNNKGKKRKAKKKVTNPVFLLASIAFGFGGLTVVFFTMIYFLNRAGKVEEMLTYVPADVNWVRGVNVGLMTKYPGYATEVNKFYTLEIKAATDHIAKAAGHDSDAFLDYLMVAKQRPAGGGGGTMYVFRSSRSMKPDALAAGLGATEAPVNGERGFKFPANAPGVLAGATMIVPTNRIVAVFAPGNLQGGMTSASTVGKGGKGDSFALKLNATGRVIIRGSMWLLMRNTGALANYLETSTKVVDKDFAAIFEKSKASPMFGVWSTPGGSGVRVGAAFECADKESAAAVAKSMKTGPLGKGDESEAPNQLKAANLQFISNKKVFGEFMQNVEFLSQRECAYAVSSLAGEGAKAIMGSFNSTAMGVGQE